MASPTPRHSQLSQSSDYFFISIRLSCVTSLHRGPTSERATAIAAGHFTVVCTWAETRVVQQLLNVGICDKEIR
jgi:hypothetical protein